MPPSLGVVVNSVIAVTLTGLNKCRAFWIRASTEMEELLFGGDA